ncbi:MAG TPA: GreA/GreB family elongation factor [Polyangia bacterium]|nr:GreA/GreB family elongation factor [Polyangia bacterium]
MSKAFTKDDAPPEPPVARRRAPLPAGVPNYVTGRGLQALRDELGALEAAQPRPEGFAARRAELEERIAAATVVPAPRDRDEIRFGARVEVEGAEGRREIQIVGVDEAEPGLGRVAFTAPLARALLGRRLADTVSVRTPGGDEALQIVSIRYDDGG